ncbi:hypothetical protein [Akkermansia glycaniphila]|nr:hypothetical protein [Akkermansia glycaniphila]
MKSLISSDKMDSAMHQFWDHVFYDGSIPRFCPDMAFQGIMRLQFVRDLFASYMEMFDEDIVFPGFGQRGIREDLGRNYNLHKICKRITSQIWRKKAVGWLYQKLHLDADEWTLGSSNVFCRTLTDEESEFVASSKNDFLHIFQDAIMPSDKKIDRMQDVYKIYIYKTHPKK